MDQKKPKYYHDIWLSVGTGTGILPDTALLWTCKDIRLGECLTQEIEQKHHEQTCCFIIAQQYCWNNAEKYCWSNSAAHTW